MFRQVCKVLGVELRPMFVTKRNIFVLIVSDERFETEILLDAINGYLHLGKPVLFLSFLQKLSYFIDKANELGFDLSQAIARGGLQFVDGLELFKSLLECYLEGNVPMDHPLAVMGHPNQPERLKMLYDLLCTRLSQLLNSKWKLEGPGHASEEAVLILDNVNILIMLGVAECDVLDFVQYCRKLVSSTFERGVLLLNVSKGSPSQTISYYAHMSDIFIETAGNILRVKVREEHAQTSDLSTYRFEIPSH